MIKLNSLISILFLVAILFDCESKRTEPSAVLYQDTVSWPVSFEIGRNATTKEIDAWNIDVRPDGEGLPRGEGVVAKGKILYAAKCASCHGRTGSEGPYDRLVTIKNEDGSKDSDSKKSIGSYWPYATTIYDYVHRAMPYHAPGSLTPDEVYSLTAFLLYANQIIDSTQVINASTLPKVIMPARKLFVNDDRQGGAQVR